MGEGPILAVFTLAVCDTVAWKKKSVFGLIPVPGGAPETPGTAPPGGGLMKLSYVVHSQTTPGDLMSWPLGSSQDGEPACRESGAQPLLWSTEVLGVESVTTNDFLEMWHGKPED